MASNNDNKSATEALTQAVSKLSDILATAADGGGQRKYLDYEGLTELVSKLGQTYATLAALADYAKTGDIPTLSSLGGVGTVSASGTSPLTLSASKTGTTVAITGSVSNASTSASGLMTSTQVSNLNSLVSGAVTSASASGTSPLTLNASKSGNSLAITGSVDLSDYAKSSDIPTLSGLGGVETVSASGTSPLSLSASKTGTTVTISGSVSNATANTAGVVRPYTVLSNAPTVNSATTTSGRYYGVSANSNNQLVVNVPWTDTTSSLSDLGGVGSVSASGTSPLTLSASKSGTSVSISGSVDLSAYAKNTDLSGLVASSEVATIKALTEAEYEALRTKESNVLYVITE